MLVLCCGMIRSGSTLQYNIARSLVEHVDRGETYGWATEDGAGVDRAEIERVASGDRMFVVKSHDLLNIDREPLPEGAFALCYCYRDLRDMAGSAKTHWSLETDELIERVRGALDAYERVRQMPRCILQSYELLTSDAPASAHQISEHLGLGLSPETTRSIAEQWSIDKVEKSGVTKEVGWIRNAKQAVRSSGLSGPAKKLWRLLPLGVRSKLDPVHRDDSLLHPGHISRFTKQGRQSREALTEDELARVTDMGADWLREHGYPLEDTQIPS